MGHDGEFMSRFVLPKTSDSEWEPGKEMHQEISCHPGLSLSITIRPWSWWFGLDLSSRGENTDSELSEGHVHQLHNPSAEEIEAPKDQTLVEVKPQGFDPRWEIRIKLGNFTTLNPVFNQRLGQRSPENSGICGMFFLKKLSGCFSRPIASVA